VLVATVHSAKSNVSFPDDGTPPTRSSKTLANRVPIQSKESRIPGRPEIENARINARHWHQEFGPVRLF
jgi:hypothetical protein